MDKNIIKEIIDSINNPFDNKCKPLSEIRTVLSGMDSSDKHNQLLEKGLLNKAEEDHLRNLLDLKKDELINIKDAEDLLKDNPNNKLAKYMLSEAKRSLGSLDEYIFKYERRLLDDSKPITNNNAIPSVNVSDFRNDNTGDILYDDRLWSDKLGDIERANVEVTMNSPLTNDMVDNLRTYFGDDAYLLNSYLNNGSQWNGLSKAEQDNRKPYYDKLSRTLTEAINSTDGLTVDARLYHVGTFDPSLMEGDKVSFKGFTSTSFSEEYAKDFNNEVYSPDGSVEYTYCILARKGTKGVSANTSPVVLTEHHEEHEYLLDKGFSGTILNVDVENHMVYVLGD